MNDLENTSSEINKELSNKWKKERDDYINWNQEHKQNYWDRYIFSMYFHHEWNTFPIKIKNFREKHKELEPNFDKFIHWIIESLKDFWYTIEIKDIFKLDKQAK
jgi:hypothetical protein